jgi:DNA-binding NarL/FixJ family response regulator
MEPASETAGATAGGDAGRQRLPAPMAGHGARPTVRGGPGPGGHPGPGVPGAPGAPGTALLRVVVQERRRFYREGIAMVLSSEADLRVVGTGESAADAREMCRALHPDVVITEADARDWDPCRLSVVLRRHRRGVRIVGLHRTLDEVGFRLAYRAGFDALVSPSAGLAVLLEAVRGTSRRWRPAAPLTPPIATSRDRMITPRQLDVLRLVSLGSTTEEVASRLGISPKTVAHHKQRVFRRLGVQNQAHAVSIAMRQGLLAANHALGDAGLGATDVG